MITGFRWSAHGAQGVYGVTPDLSTWGKAMGNGFPISALAGRRELMELGGLRTDAERVFLLSTTHGPESVGLTAFRAVVEAYRREDPVGTMRRQGTKLAEARERGHRRSRPHRLRRRRRPPVLPGVPHPRHRRATLAGDAHGVPRRAAASRGPRAVVRHLRGAHRRRRRADRGRGRRRAPGLREALETARRRCSTDGPSPRRCAPRRSPAASADVEPDVGGRRGATVGQTGMLTPS